jgi:integrase/recombinase XerD
MSSAALLGPLAPMLPVHFHAMPEGGRRFWEFFTVNIRNPNPGRS